MTPSTQHRVTRGLRAAPTAAGLALLSLLLLACAGGEEAEPATTAAAENTASEAEAAAPAEGDPAAAEAAAPELAALPPEPVIDDDPDRLLGLSSVALDDLLGAPKWVRREAPAQIRQYRGNDCVLDAVLYQEADGERVSYVEARDGDGNISSARDCLNQLLRAQLEQDAG